MGDVVNLRNIPSNLSSDVGHTFVVDCTRAAEGLLTDRELAEKWELSPKDWRAITKNRELGHAIRAERERRVRSGEAARESAQKIFVRAPQVLGTILDDKSASPRHRIESAKELRATAAVGDSAEGRPDGKYFNIVINLGADQDGKEVIERYSKSVTINPNDTDPNSLDKNHGDE